MVLARTTAHTIFALVAIATAACGASTTPDTSTTTGASSALEVTPSKDAGSLTLTTDGGACGAASSLIDAHKDQLIALCHPGQLPVPADVASTSCDAGSIVSITFKCVDAKAPPPPKHGCARIEVKDDAHAISAGGTEHLASLPAVLCPMMGGAPPPPPPGGRPPAPPAPPADGPAPPLPGDGDQLPLPPVAGGPDAPPAPLGPPPGHPGPDGQPQPPVGGGAQPPVPPGFVECCAPDAPPPDAPGAPASPGEAASTK